MNDLSSRWLPRIYTARCLEPKCVWGAEGSHADVVRQIAEHEHGSIAVHSRPQRASRVKHN